MSNYRKEIIVRSAAGLGCSSDFLSTSRGTSCEQYMMFELLYLSFQDLISKNEKDRQEAIDWFESEEDEYCFSFKFLAESIGTTAEEIRKNIIDPAINGNHAPILRITKFAKVNRMGVLYEQ